MSNALRSQAEADAFINDEAETFRARLAIEDERRMETRKRKLKIAGMLRNYAGAKAQGREGEVCSLGERAGQVRFGKRIKLMTKAEYDDAKLMGLLLMMTGLV